MKKNLTMKALLSIVLVLFNGLLVFGQEVNEKTLKNRQDFKFNSLAVVSKNLNFSDCKDLLADGLRDTEEWKHYESFFSDSKSYFSSEKFKSDYKSGKWDGGISVVVYGVPISLSGGESNEKVQQFQERIQQANSVEVGLQTYTTVSRSTLNVAIAEAYSECVGGKYGLSIEASGERQITVTISYKPIGTRDKKPFIVSVDLLGVDEGDKKKILTGRLRKGMPLQDGISFLVHRKPGEEFLIALNTSNGLSIVKRLESEENSSINSVPVGTVIASLLDFKAFSELTKNDVYTRVWSPVKSKWAPCDGRALTGSKYQTMWAGSIGSHAPDLRGVFLRGLNSFDPLEPAVVNAAQANPEPTKRGEFQGDMFRFHTHPFSSAARREVSGRGSTSDFAWGSANYTTQGAGGHETRPKNVSVYYYIRIN